MKGVIVAGGLATRLRPLTWVTNKHLLPVYNKPMIYYPLEAMRRAGIDDVLIMTSPDHAGGFCELIKAGEEFNLNVYYGIQKNPTGGIANAIGYAEKFADGEKTLILLGDGIFGYNLKKDVDYFKKRVSGAIVFGMKMPTESKQYGVIEIDTESKKVLSIEEKPDLPKSDIAQTGIYMYDGRVFDFISRLKPSARGQLEVSELNNHYLREGTLECRMLPWWIDAGTSHDELLRANILVEQKVREGELT